MKMPIRGSLRWVFVAAVCSLHLLFAQSEETRSEVHEKAIGSLAGSVVDQASSLPKEGKSSGDASNDAGTAQADADAAKRFDKIDSVRPSEDSKFSVESAVVQQASRGFFIDVVAAVFGVLAVVFALVTLLAAVFGFVFGVSKFKELISKIESEITDKVNFEFKKKLDVVVEEQIKPKVEDIISTNLKEVLEDAQNRIRSEISKTVSDVNLKEELMKVVTSEIQSRLASTSAAPVAPKEFEG